MKIITTILFILFSFISFSQKSGYLVGNANGSFSIGTDVTTAPLTIANFTTSFPAPQSGTIVHLVSDVVTNGRLSFDTYSNSQFGSFYQGRKGLGSAGSPTAVTADHTLVGLGGDGYGDNGFHGVSVGAFLVRSEGTFTNTSAPTYLSFWATQTGSISPSEKMRLISTGQLRLVNYGSGTFTGTPTRSLQVDASGNIIEGSLGGSASWGNITGTLSSQTDLQAALDGKLATNGNGSSLTGLTKSQVGLANVDNTSDANKPISTATQSALDGKQASLVSGTNIKTVNGNSLLGSGNVSISGAPTFINLASNFSSTSVTPATVTGWSFSVTSGVTYRITVIADYQTAATTTGGIIGISLSGGAAGSVRGYAAGAISQSAVATELKIPIRATSGAGSTLTTTGVSVINSPHYIGIDITFTCTVSGTFNIVWGTEVAASAAQLNANSSLIYQALN